MTKKTTLNLLLLILTNVLFSQIPQDYYDTAENLSGDALKLQLNLIIDNHTEFEYTVFGNSSTDVWDILEDTDRDPNNPNNVILLYSGQSVNGPQHFNGGNGWIREHVWAKSRGDFGTDIGPGTDVHALRPLDLTTNVNRNNRSFDNCTSCEDVIDQWGNNTGSKRDTNSYSFEPRDEVKGDVARMIFYMAVRYEGTDGYVDLEPSYSVVPLGNNDPIHGKWSTLLEWNNQDPVDDWERNRNNIIYNSYQNNRNPFIDYAELAEHIWGTLTDVPWSEALNTNEFNETTITVYPNPTSNNINIKGLKEDTQVKIYDALGRLVQTKLLNSNTTTINVSKLKGIYIARITTSNKTISKRIIVK